MVQNKDLGYFLPFRNSGGYVSKFLIDWATYENDFSWTLIKPSREGKKVSLVCLAPSILYCCPYNLKTMSTDLSPLPIHNNILHWLCLTCSWKQRNAFIATSEVRHGHWTALTRSFLQWHREADINCYAMADISDLLELNSNSSFFIQLKFNSIDQLKLLENSARL